MDSKHSKKVMAFVFLLFSISASASPANDRIYALESVGWLRASDNVDGIFGSYVDDVYRSYFSKQTRFSVKPLTTINEILSQSKIPYSILIQDSDVLRKIARRAAVESVVRTRILKEGSSYRFILEWVFAPRGDVLSTDEFRFDEDGKTAALMNERLPNMIRTALDRLIAGLPFLAQITGVEQDTVTVNIGRNQNVSPRQILVIYTLQSLKRHPIYKRIEEWRWQLVGKVQVEQVEDSMLFGKIIEVEPGQAMLRSQKVREVLALPPATLTQEEEKSSVQDEARLGWVAGTMGVGAYSRTVGNGSATTGRGGSGLGFQFDAEALVWLNSRFLANASVLGGLINYSPTDLATNNATGTSYSGSMTQFRLAVGASLLPAKTIFDTNAWVTVGYRSTQFSLPATTTDFTGTSTLSSLSVGLAGQMRVNEEISAFLGLELGLFRSLNQTTPAFGSAVSTGDIQFNLGANYRFMDRLYFRGLIRIISTSADFSSSRSIGQNAISLCPSIVYTF
jgi:hypothetical protein